MPASKPPPIHSASRSARLFRNGRNQALRIPREFEIEGNEVLIIKDGDRLVLEPIKRTSGLAALLASWDALDQSFPDVDGGLLPLNDVKL
jgi:antitoxin VapB